MVNEYEVNSNTLALLPIGTHVTKVIEKQDSFLVNMTPSDIIDQSCRSFGSSYFIIFAQIVFAQTSISFVQKFIFNWFFICFCCILVHNNHIAVFGQAEGGGSNGF